jgi:hypothetical protein
MFSAAQTLWEGVTRTLEGFFCRVRHTVLVVRRECRFAQLPFACG